MKNLRIEDENIVNKQKKKHEDVKDLWKEDEREREEKKESSNDGESNPPSSNPTRVFLVEVDLHREQNIHT